MDMCYMCDSMNTVFCYCGIDVKEDYYCCKDCGYTITVVRDEQIEYRKILEEMGDWQCKICNSINPPEKVICKHTVKEVRNYLNKI